MQHTIKFPHPFIWITFLLLTGDALKAGGEKLDIGARAIALGGAFTGLANSSTTLFYNPAGVMLLPYREASFFYSRPYGLKELDHVTLSYIDPNLLPRSLGAIGLSTKRFGYELYNETSLGVTYGNSLERKFFYGLTLNYQHVFIKNYGNASAVGLDLGVLALITPTLSIGFVSHNLNNPKIGASHEELAQTYTLGLSYKLLTSVLLVIDAEKDVRYPINIKSGMEYKPVSSFTIRIGFSSEPSRFAGGFGVHYQLLDIDYAFYTHRDLGLTNQLSVSLRFGNGSTPELASAELNRVVLSSFKQPTQRLEAGEKLDINSASLSELLRVPKMSKAIAERIVRFRTEVGKFREIEELLQLKGIDSEIFESLASYLIIR